MARKLSAVTGASVRQRQASAGFLLPQNSVSGDHIQAGAVDLTKLAQEAAKYLVPVGVTFPFAGTVAPDGYLLCFGQEVSQATYAALYAVLGNTYGAASPGFFKLPDARGRTIIGKDNMGGVAANRVTTAAGGVDGATLGAAGGVQAHTLTSAQSGVPSHTHPVSGSTDTSGSHRHDLYGGGGGGNSPLGNTSGGLRGASDTNDGSHSHSVSGTASAPSVADAAQAHPNVQPSLVQNMIIKT